MTPLQRAYNRTFFAMRTPNFRLYTFGQIVSGIGSWMQFAAQFWLVLKLTDSAFYVGLTTALQFAPILLGSAWGGLIVDRVDKRKLLIVTQALSGILAVVLAVVTLSGIVELWMVYVLAVAAGAVMMVDNPARRAFVPELVPGEGMANAVALNSAIFTLARVLGPVAAGIVIDGFGIGWCFLLNALSYVAAIWTFRAMRISELRPSEPVVRAKKQLREGFRYAWNNRPVRVVLLLTAFVGTFAFNYATVMPVMAKEVFDGNASTYATLMAFIGIGSLAGALWSAHFGRASMRITIAAAITLGITMTLASIAPSLITELLVLVAVGITSMTLVTMATAVCNEQTAPEFRGRVMALFSMAFLGSTPIGSPIVGVVVDQFGARAGVAVGAASALVGGLVAFAYQRRQTSVRVPVDPAEVALASQTAAVP